MSRHQLLLGCIADDFTGATDLANNLVRAGMRVVQAIGVPQGPLHAQSWADVDAVVIALKTRTVPPEMAVRASLQALQWLQEAGAQQIYFKYCSTFDSRYTGEVRGNIGPVTEALMDAMGCAFTIATPAFPDNQRTVFKGHLFVGDVLLSDSGMRHHPLTPMQDANLVRVLQAQCQRKVGLIDHTVVAQGAQAVTQKILQLQQQGVGIAVVDAVSNADLLRSAPAWKALALVTAGSGVAIGLPANFGLAPSSQASALPAAQGARAVVAGSCSQATQRQVQHFLAQAGAAWPIDVQQVLQGADVVSQVLHWARTRLGVQPLLIYSTADAAQVQALQAQWGGDAAGATIEQALAAIARGFVQAGVRQLVVAGGETSGACVQALEIDSLQIGAQIDPGVPWCFAHSAAAGNQGLHIALKSGNFGADDFFTRAFEVLP